MGLFSFLVPFFEFTLSFYPEVSVKFDPWTKILGLKVCKELGYHFPLIEGALSPDLLEKEFLVDIHDVGDCTSKDYGEFFS
jgi:hypothetical protein